MDTYAVYFRPLGPLATWPLASDTLFGAVCWGIRMLGLMDDAALEQWLEARRQTPPFAFSHAFPVYWGTETPLRCYPRPANFQPTFAEINTLADEYRQQKGVTLKRAKVELARFGKQFKKVDYVSENVLAEIAGNRLGAWETLQGLLFQQSRVSIKGDILYTSAEAKSLPEVLFETEAMQHNQIDRVAGATVEGMLYYRDETFFAPKAGLWALLRAEASDFAQYVHPALRYQADTGFGADRTSGKGHFSIEVQPSPPLPESKSPRAVMTLSHYLPVDGELLLRGEPLAYILKTLRPKREQKYPRPLPVGVSSTPVYKQAIRIFEPGSIFPYVVNKEIYGQLARLTPPDQEPVYQSGAALMVYL